MTTNHNIPEHWQKKKLGEVCNVLDNLRKPINASERQQRIAGKSQEVLYPYYGATGQVGWIDDFMTDGEFILIGEDGAPFLDIFKDKAYKIKGKSWVNNHAHILKGKEQFLLDDFALYYLNSINYREFVNGTTRLKLTKSNLVEIPFIVPPLPEQHAIVAKIEALLSELENGQQQLLTAQQQLKVYRQSLLKWAFEGKLTNKNVNEGELPKSWKWVKFGSIFNGTPQNGLYKPSTEYGSGVPILRIDGFYDGAIVNDYEYKRVRISNEELSKYKLSIDDIVVNRVNSMSHLGKCGLLKSLKEPTVFESNVMKIQINKDSAVPRYISNYLSSLRGLKELTKNAKHAVNQASINQTDVSNVAIPLAPLSEQQQIVLELESKLTVCDKIEETISQSLQQAETLRQSILKRAFEGKLVTAVAEQKETKVIPLYKPKNEYFYQLQLLGIVAKASKQKQIEHGEMTLAKYAYLMDKVYNVPTYFNYNRWHLGPYPPAIKKVINNKQYFKKSGKHIEVLNEKTLFNSTNPHTAKMQSAVNDLTDIFSKYSTKERSHKTELLATVCKVIEDIQSTNLKAVRQSMAEWKINLKDEKHKSKAEKFNEPETEKCLVFIKEKGWDKKLMK